MEFRLTYEGKLYSESHRNKSVRLNRATHKQDIRKIFHPQLRRLWSLNPWVSNLHRGDEGTSAFLVTSRRDRSLDHTIPLLAARFSQFGYRFVPLATRNLELLCAIDILMLRFTDNHGVLEGGKGDIDNRFKVLFDALTKPNDAVQLGSHTTPGSDEDPFFCLLQDDSMVTKASVQTDTLLEPVSDPPDDADVRAIITVKLWPGQLTVANMGFA